MNAGSNMTDETRDRIYAACALAISAAGAERESLFLARLALLLFERIGDEAQCLDALSDAARDLPSPSLSAVRSDPADGAETSETTKPA